MKIQNRIQLSLLLGGVLVFAAGCATTRPESAALRDARLAVQDARDAGAAELAPDKLNLAAGDLAAAQREWNSGHEAMRHDAEQRAIASRARSESERLRLEAELRAREDQARLQSEMQARQAEQRAAEEREKALQTQLETERQRSAEQQHQAEIDALKAQIDEQAKSAEAARDAAAEQNAKLEEARRQEEARRRAAEETAQKQGQSQQELIIRLQQLERSTRLESRGIVVTLPGNIYFETNRSDLQPGIRARLADIGKALATAPERHIIVEGHTDSTGRGEYNLKLSQLRAASVRAVLIANGVASERTETQGYGATKPVASNATPAGRSQNRRVEIIVQDAVSPAPH